MKAKALAAISFLAGGILTAAISQTPIYSWLHDWLRPYSGAFVSAPVQEPLFHLARSGSRELNGWVKAPVDLSVFLIITNISSGDRSVSDYQLEVDSNGQRRVFKRIPLVDYPVSIEAESDRGCVIFDFSRNSFDQELDAQQGLPKDHSIMGWAFFSGERGIDLEDADSVFLLIYDDEGRRSSVKLHRTSRRPFHLFTWTEPPQGWSAPWRHDARSCFANEGKWP